MYELCEQKCLPLAETSESRVFFLKLIGDYYRYSVEDDCNERDSSRMQNSLEFYNRGLKIACTDLDPLNPVRLALTLNLAVFYKEIANQTDKAILLTEISLSQAIERIDDCGT